MSDFFYLSGYVLAAIMTLCAFFAWRKAQSFHALLLESTNRFLAIRNRGTQLEAELARAEEKQAQSKDHTIKLEKMLGQEKLKNESALEALRKESITAKDLNHQQSLKLDHLQQQVTALMEQVRESDYLRKEAEKKLAYASHETHEKLTQNKQNQAQEVDTLKRQLRLIENEYKAYRQKVDDERKGINAVDPETFVKVQRKASHFESLYKSMRGLREMADERNKNWEIALRKFSGYILRHADGKREVIESQALGPMVGEALDVIGAKLLEDEFSNPKLEGATTKDYKDTYGA